MAFSIRKYHDAATARLGYRYNHPIGGDGRGGALAFRVVNIEHPAEVHARAGQLIVAMDGGTVTIPIEDILMLIADAPNVRLSTMCLSMLAEHHVMVVTMGRNHLPSSLTIPTVSNARQARVAIAQAGLGRDLADRLWTRVVVRKMLNQADALEALGDEGASEVRSFASQVEVGDPTNREGAAAHCYFSHLKPGLCRRKGDPLNSALNYGYAIVRAAMVRSLVAAGFVPALGIHHHSQLNAFNLADDLMEPFRPVVDLRAVEVTGTDEKLSSAQRKSLRGVLHDEVRLGSGRMSVLRAIESMGTGFRGAIYCEDASLLPLPELAGSVSVGPAAAACATAGEQCA